MNTLIEVLSSAWWMVVALGLLVTCHEFGHFWVARRCGVKVLRFSVGFGRPIWRRMGRDGTEYVVGWLPLGGYVKMLDGREGDVREQDLPQEFNGKPVGQRMAIVAAGPVVNLLLCFALLWLMFLIGRPDHAPVVGRVQGIAAEGGMQAGDRMLAVGDRATPTWTEASFALAVAAIDRGTTPVRVRTADGGEATRQLDFSGVPMGEDLRDALGRIGVVPAHAVTPPIVGSVQAGPAAGVLRPGDRILAVAGQPVTDWAELPGLVARAAAEGPVPVQLARGAETLEVTVQPTRVEERGQARWRLGIVGQAPEPVPMDALLRYGPVAAVPAAFAEMRHQTTELFRMVGRAFTGHLAIQDTVSGPIGIARAAKAYADRGLAWYLTLLAALSLSIAILNLLPIPVLDGGHLLYYLIELVKGRPLSDGAMAAGQYVGLALLLGLMGLAFYNDLQGLIR